MVIVEYRPFWIYCGMFDDFVQCSLNAICIQCYCTDSAQCICIATASSQLREQPLAHPLAYDDLMLGPLLQGSLTFRRLLFTTSLEESST